MHGQRRERFASAAAAVQRELHERDADGKARRDDGRAFEDDGGFVSREREARVRRRRGGVHDGVVLVAGFGLALF